MTPIRFVIGLLGVSLALLVSMWDGHSNAEAVGGTVDITATIQCQDDLTSAPGTQLVMQPGQTREQLCRYPLDTLTPVTYDGPVDVQLVKSAVVISGGCVVSPTAQSEFDTYYPGNNAPPEAFWSISAQALPCQIEIRKEALILSPGITDVNPADNSVSLIIEVLSPVGGIGGLLDAPERPAEQQAAGGGPTVPVVVGAAIGGLAVLSAGAWIARRRFNES